MVATITDVAIPRWAEWERVTAPTLLVYAENGIFTEDQKSAFVARGTNVTRTDLAGASHDAHLDTFEQWTAALSAFINAR